MSVQKCKKCDSYISTKEVEVPSNYSYFICPVCKTRVNGYYGNNVIALVIVCIVLLVVVSLF